MNSRSAVAAEENMLPDPAAGSCDEAEFMWDIILLPNSSKHAMQTDRLTPLWPYRRCTLRSHYRSQDGGTDVRKQLSTRPDA